MTATELVSVSRVPSRADQRREVHGLVSDPVIGKDILELLSSAMYVDARTIFREYVQNSADSIDSAFASGLLSDTKSGRIEITLDAQNRTIKIRDNGVGIPAASAERVLTSFGASPKRGTTARGFRGVGRLSALGYAQTVSFKAKAAGEEFSTEVRWDCRKLKAALLDSAYKHDLRQLVKDVVTVTVERERSPQSHYFEVFLDRVVRIKNDLLLHPEEVQKYLAQVAPVEFNDDFPFAREIANRLRQHLLPCRAQIFVNGAATPITRPHLPEFIVTGAKIATPSELQFFELPDDEGGIGAIGWLAHHDYLGAFHSGSEVRGLRARVRDMQVGDADVFAEIFPEARFNSWTVGEVHILDRRVMVNGRRDGFEQNAAYFDLLSKLVPLGREIARRCRLTSARRNRVRAFELRASRVDELLTSLTQRYVSKARATKLRRDIGAHFGMMKKLARSSILDQADKLQLEERLAALHARYSGLDMLVAEDPLAELPPNRKRLYEHVLDLVYDCSPSKTVASVLIERISARLAAEGLRARRRRLVKAKAKNRSGKTKS